MKIKITYLKKQLKNYEQMIDLLVEIFKTPLGTMVSNQRRKAILTG